MRNRWKSPIQDRSAQPALFLVPVRTIFDRALSQTRLWRKSGRCRHKPFVLAQLFLTATLMIVLAACSQDLFDAEQGTSAGTLASEFAQGHTGEFPAVRRVDLGITATGSLRPGESLLIRAHATARFDVASLDFTLALPDADPVDFPNAGKVARSLGSASGTYPAGGAQEIVANVRFPRSGYYRVVAVVHTNQPETRRGVSQDTVVLPSSYETLWILIDEQGGRLTEGYDANVLRDHPVMLYGSYGPFVGRRLPERPNWPTTDLGMPGRIQSANSTGTSGASGAFAQYPGATVTGTVRYENFDVPYLLDPVPGAEVEAMCYGKSSPELIIYDLAYPVSGITGSYGNFTVSCDLGYTYVEGYVRLRNLHAYATSEYNGAAGAFFSGFDGANLDLLVANDFAARVWLDLRERVPMAFSLSGRSKARQYAEVSANNENWGIYYCPTTAYQNCHANDMIKTNYQGVFGRDVFTTIHEFAHGFHYYAVEPWGSNACDGVGGVHGFTEHETLPCAFVEGFADFFGMWLLGDRLRKSPFGGDWGLENNWADSTFTLRTNPPPNAYPENDGMRIEAAVAAFLYDLVDGPSSPDGFSNEADGDSDDGLSVPISWILNVMQYCRLNGSSLQMDGPDQLVYCASRVLRVPALRQ